MDFLFSYEEKLARKDNLFFLEGNVLVKNRPTEFLSLAIKETQNIKSTLLNVFDYIRFYYQHCKKDSNNGSELDTG